MKIIKKIFLKNKIYLFNYKKNSFFEGVYRFLAVIISPIFIKFNPNLISFLSLICGFFGLVSVTILDIKIQYLIIFFFISFVLDFTDGLVARYNMKSSFHGRFIDGLFDIFVIGFLHIVLLMYLLKFSNSEFKNLPLIFYLTTILIMPVQHLILDRFASLARWCNQISKRKNIKPYYRNIFLNKFTMIFFDIQHFLLVYILIFNDLNFSIIVNLFFATSFIASLFSIIIYILLSKKNFNFITNQKDNNE